MTDQATADDPFEAFKKYMPLKTAADLRACCVELMPKFGNGSVGTPVTGPEHRAILIPSGPDRKVMIDVIEPVGKGPHPVLIYLHGGGWVYGDLDIYYQLNRRFAEQGFVVVAVDWGLAPENPFPVGYNDCVAATKWAVANIAQYGGDPNRIVMAGDSAGGNLTAGIAVSEPDLPIKAVGLLYGVYDLEHMPTTPATHAPGFLADLHRAYLGAENLHLLKDPRVGPIHAAAKMPPAIIAVGSDDAGLSESENLAAELRKAGVEHRLEVVKDHPHGFLQLEMLPQCLPMIATISSYLKQHAP